MTAFALWRCVEGFRSGSAEGRGWQEDTTNRRRDKSACPKRCKPLTRLAFWRACRSVAGMKPGFSEEFQGFPMHGPEKPLSGASS